MTTKKTSRIKRIVIAVAMIVAMLFVGTDMASATTKEVPITKVTFPTSVTMKVGETKTLTVTTSPSNTTYKTNIEWGCQTNNRFSVKVNGSGTYWGKPSSETLTAKSAGTGRLNTRVKVFDSNGKFIRSYDIETKVTVVNPSTTKATTKSTTKATTKSTTKATTKPTTKATTKSTRKNGNVSVGAAYTELNKFRTTKRVWQWNSDNRTKTYFNTKSSNTLKPLKRNVALEKTAQLRAKEIATRYSHTRPNGKTWFTAYPRAYSYRGESIAAGYTSAYAVTECWKETNCSYAKQGHRRNMLNKKFTSVGIGCYKKGNTLYWVQCFGK